MQPQIQMPVDILYSNINDNFCCVILSSSKSFVNHFT